MNKFKLNTKVKIPLTKRGVKEGATFNSFKEELKPTWKYLLINFDEEDSKNIGVCGPNDEFISYNSFYESDLELYDEKLDNFVKDCVKDRVEVCMQSAWNTQEAGTHYKDMAIQPMDYSMKNNLNALQHTIVKYVSRYKAKNGIEDLKKAKHCIEMLIEYEQNNK